MGKRQHYIPQSYLDLFTDPRTPEGHDPHLWVFTRKQNEIKKRAPKNTAQSSHRYTFEEKDGTKNESLEAGFSQLESIVAPILKRISSTAKITEKDKPDIAGYMGMLSARSPENEGRVVDVLERIHRTQMAILAVNDPKMREILENSGLDKTPEEVAREITEGGLFNVEIPRAMALGPMMQANADVFTSSLPQMHWKVLRSEIPAGILTSDYPVCMFSPIAADSGWPPGLAYKDIEVTFPLSRDLILLISREEVEPDAELNPGKTLLYNWRSFFYASEFYAASEEIIVASYNLLVDEVQRDQPSEVGSRYLRIDR